MTVAIWRISQMTGCSFLIQYSYVTWLLHWYYKSCELYWTSPEDNTPQNSSFTATYHQSRKLSKLHETDLSGAYPSGQEGTWEQWQWVGIPHFPELQHYRNLTIRLFSVISRSLVGEMLLLCRGAVGVFYSPRRFGKWVNLRLITWRGTTPCPELWKWNLTTEGC